MPFDILLVDDHKIMRDGIKAILKLHPDFHVVGEAENGQDALQYLKRQPADVVLMDIGLPGLSGIETTSELMRQSSDARIIILSMYEDEDSVVAAMRAGARGFVLKQASEIDLVDALRTVARGGTYLSPEVSDKLLRRLQNGNMDTKTASPTVEGLSPRELQVMRMVAEGKTSKEIAVMLDLGLQTVRSYRKTMMKKLGVSNVAGLTQIALASGVTQIPGYQQQPQQQNQQLQHPPPLSQQQQLKVKSHHA